LMRYLVDTQPDLVNKLLKKRYSHQELEGIIASALGIEESVFWQEIDQRVVHTYNLELT